MPDRVRWFNLFRNDARTKRVPLDSISQRPVKAPRLPCYGWTLSLQPIIAVLSHHRPLASSCRKVPSAIDGSHTRLLAVSPYQCRIFVGGCLEIRNVDKYIICDLHRAELRCSSQGGGGAERGVEVGPATSRVQISVQRRFSWLTLFMVSLKSWIKFWGIISS
jgi:hypothetical protein